MVLTRSQRAAMNKAEPQPTRLDFSKMPKKHVAAKFAFPQSTEQKLADENQLLSARCQAINRLVDIHNKQRAEIDTLKKDNQSLKKDYESLNTAFIKKADELEEQRGIVYQQTITIDKLQSLIDVLADEVRQLNFMISNLKEQVKTLTASKESLIQYIDGLEELLRQSFGGVQTKVIYEVYNEFRNKHFKFDHAEIKNPLPTIPTVYSAMRDELFKKSDA